MVKRRLEQTALKAEMKMKTKFQILFYSTITLPMTTIFLSTKKISTYVYYEIYPLVNILIIYCNSYVAIAEIKTSVA